MPKKLFLLDAFALVFRAYYALIRNPRITSKGRNTNAQFGFTNTIIELLTNQKPTHMAVCFDTHAPTERHTDFADYKANRQETPEDILSAVPDIKRIIEGLNIPVIEADGYEADDVIGALAKKAEKEGYEVYMVTPDKDYGQLVSENIKIYKPPYQGGKFEILGPAEVCAKWDIENVDQVIDILGLMGDAVDNIPGIKGVGEKTAAKLIKEYGSLENILANADNIKGSLGEKVRAGKELALLSKKLATIITNVPVEFHEEDFRVKEMNKEALKEIFAELEFKTLGKRILGEETIIITEGGNPQVETKIKKTETAQMDLFGNVIEQTEVIEITIKTEETDSPVNKNIHNSPHNYILADTDELIKELTGKLSALPEICFDTETTGVDANDAELVGLSFSVKPGEGYYVPCPADKDGCIKILNEFKKLFTDASKTWVGHNIKYDMLILKWYGFELLGNIFDTMLAHYVIEPDGKNGMDALSEKYLGYEPVHIEELIGKKGKGQGNMRDVEPEKIKDYAAEDADITLQLKNISLPLLK
ncbi:MAG TPA: 5'-3' exonuclease H3TH domain-containing protein, partial [Ferruginibacter sp.]|nr:5'-3' exonuclease H3TH domain-containing protein [Ferruginibacter sp.]